MTQHVSSDDPAVEAVYRSFVRTVLHAVDQAQFDVEDMKDLFVRLKSESETAQVLIFSAYLEDKIRELLRSHLVEIESKQAEDRIFGAHGPLATFSSRVLMLRHLGWIASRSAKNLDSWRRIRNEFAHAAYRVSFDDPRIEALWHSIELEPDPILVALSTEFSDLQLLQMSELQADRQRLITLALLAVDVFHQLLILPVAKSWSVAPADVMTSAWEDMPAPAKHVWETGAQAIVRIAESSETSKQSGL